MSGSPPPKMQPMAHSQSWGGLRARRGCRRFYGNNRLYGEGCQEEGRRLLGVGVGCCAHQPRGAGPGGPPASLLSLSVQIKALSTTQGSYADCARCKADCRDNWLGSHAAQTWGTARARAWGRGCNFRLPVPQDITLMHGRRCQPRAVLCTSPWKGRVGIRQQHTWGVLNSSNLCVHPCCLSLGLFFFFFPYRQPKIFFWKTVSAPGGCASANGSAGRPSQ